MSRKNRGSGLQNVGRKPPSTYGFEGMMHVPSAPRKEHFGRAAVEGTFEAVIQALLQSAQESPRLDGFRIIRRIQPHVVYLDENGVAAANNDVWPLVTDARGIDLTLFKATVGVPLLATSIRKDKPGVFHIIAKVGDEVSESYPQGFVIEGEKQAVNRSVRSTNRTPRQPSAAARPIHAIRFAEVEAGVEDFQIVKQLCDLAKVAVPDTITLMAPDYVSRSTGTV